MRATVAALLALAVAAPAAAEEPRTVLGAEDATLGRYDALTLKPSGPRLRLRGHVWTWAHDTAHERVVVACGRARRPLLVVDSRSPRLLATLPRLRGQVIALAWPRPDRVVALAGDGGDLDRFVVLDPVARRVVADHPLEAGAVGDVARWADGLAIVAGPPGRIGAGRLLVASADGTVRDVALPGIQAGFKPPPRKLRKGRIPISKTLSPGLAVDPAGTRAVVVAANLPLAFDVDLRTGAAAPHALGAAAAKLGEGSVRVARFAGADTVLVAGHDETVRPRARIRSAGLRALDVRAWKWRMVDPAVSWLHAVPGALLLPWFDHRRATRARTTGLAVLGPDGRPVRRLLPGRRPTGFSVSGGRLYATFHRAHESVVVDLATGRVLKRLKTALLPLLMEDDPYF